MANASGSNGAATMNGKPKARPWVMNDDASPLDTSDEPEAKYPGETPESCRSGESPVVIARRLRNKVLAWLEEQTDIGNVEALIDVGPGCAMTTFKVHFIYPDRCDRTISPEVCLTISLEVPPIE